ncbi:GntR family transcriptional regulator [Phenylobacterium sp. LjRoot219]|uniref:GntR family transcriptional regulator n=1 Tax=Phenylobacterium sp. LjRoot219 TaxID=3342283 RepID=UPI003ECD4A95
MENGRSKSSIDAAAARLREIALATPDGALLGSEDDLLQQLQVSRVTVRQAARMLERDGVLRVRRGNNGGYFAARPSVEMVEAVVVAYLDTVGMDARHVGVVTTALWSGVLREIAGADRTATRALADRLSEKVEQLDSEATISDVAKLEHLIRAEMLELIHGQYIDVIFRINAAFSRQRFGGRTDDSEPASRRPFVQNWKKAKLMELEAIAQGDATLAMMAGLHTRNLWTRREADRQSSTAEAAE